MSQMKSQSLVSAIYERYSEVGEGGEAESFSSCSPPVDEEKENSKGLIGSPSNYSSSGISFYIPPVYSPRKTRNYCPTLYIYTFILLTLSFQNRVWSCHGVCEKPRDEQSVLKRGRRLRRAAELLPQRVRARHIQESVHRLGRGSFFFSFIQKIYSTIIIIMIILSMHVSDQLKFGRCSETCLQIRIHKMN